MYPFLQNIEDVNLILIIVSLFLSILTIRFWYLYEKIKKNDLLTGLKNGFYFKIKLHRILNRKFNKSEVSLIIIDIDNFGEINENYGYTIADNLLREVARIIKVQLSRSENIFRQYSKGDEFIIIEQDCDIDQAFIIAENIRTHVKNNCGHIYGVDVTVSCGVTQFIADVDNYDTITDRLFLALVRSKKDKQKNNTFKL